VNHVGELPSDESTHGFELAGDRDGDVRADLFKLAVAKGWTLLELRRDAQTLEDVFRDLTKQDELRDRKLGRAAEETAES
jgi:ABC-2 type transport system ATP-binding protein